MLIVEPTEHDECGDLLAGDDVSLMLRAQKGDTDAFATLAGRYRTRLRAFFRLLLSDPELADDFTQETLLRLYLSREAYRPTGSFRAYLFQMGRHYYLNQRQRQSDRRQREQALREEMQATDCPEQEMIDRFEREQRRTAIDRLPVAYRLVFILHHDEGLKYTEIAARLNIPVGTVKSRMSEAVRRLRVTLESENCHE